MDSNQIDKSTLTALATARSFPSVSIFIPSAEKGPEVEQAPIRLKNAISEAETLLEEEGVRGSVASHLLAGVRSLIVDGDFWLHQGLGLGLLVDEHRRETIRLPYAVSTSVTVSDRFHIRPLVPLLTDYRSMILAVSRGSRRLFEMTRYSIIERRLDAPASMSDANWFVDREAQLQHRPSGGGSGFHGHGDDGRADHADLARYLRAVASATAAVSDLPVLLAATDDVRGIYQSVCSHPLLAANLSGNHDHTRSEDLHRAAVDLGVAGAPEIEKRRSAARSRGMEIAELGSVLAAAAQSRVDELIVDPDTASAWGTFDREEMEARITSGRDNGHVDLVDLAIEMALEHGGAVTAATVDPGVVALLRF